ncbi:stromal membrane-associated protein 1 [Purpureocillium lavendulum]|uniref:Stromal membrane-associated protein 1 n=1 Tax=Purpureocillium lavendulum TaxID=1247861 RepID=A0AB34FE96_9HYPO|nr:stromal membrane-associated protein 1 [Purpureocillium lavendulum]
MQPVAAHAPHLTAPLAPDRPDAIMSRRAPNPAAERAAQNQATIKSLLKLEPNKVCADCKRNKHPRWASWNLGVFVCIRCSGIHRGMGTHISRVKSVDLDSWTDEQLQSILSWGNARANKYWEAKLAAGHAPSEAKIENFIRTKYELKRWVMDGPMPDPATLDVDGDDDVPLSLVKEKQAIERKESIRKSSIGQSQAPRRAAPEADLIGGDDPLPARASTVSPAASKVTPKAEPAAPKTTNTKDSLLGLDFLGGSTAPPRPSSTPGVSSPAGQSRPDLKQSILSLYATAPKPQPQHQPPHQQVPQQHGQFGGMPSPPMTQQGGFNDAFGSLSIGNSAPRAAAPDPFAGLGGGSSTRSPPPSNTNAFGGLSGGSFFDKPSQPAAPVHQQKPSNSGFGGLGSFSSPAPPAASKPAQPSAMGDLFDLSSPVSQTTTSPPPLVAAPPAPASSVFNLSSPQHKPATSPPAATTSTSAFGGMSMADPWGGNEWAAPAPAAAAPPKASPELTKTTSNNMGWGGGGGGSFANTPIVPGSGGGFNPAPKVAADEEFGGWTSSAAPAPSGTSTAAPKQSGFGGDEDLFSNVWQ